MAAQATQSNQVLEAMKYFFGKRECRSVTFVDDVALSLEDEYFDLNLIDENYAEVQYYVWLDGGTGTDPAIAGKTAIPLVYTSGDSKEVLAGLLITALSALEVLTVNQGAGVVQMENAFLSVITVEDYSNAPSLTKTILKLGSGGELGAVQSGGATLTTEQDLEVITKDSQGSITQDLIQKGETISLDMSLVEMSTGNWENLIRDGYGDSEVVGSDELVGFGTSKLYQSAFSFAGQLTGHPTRLAFSDRSADITIFLTTPNMSDITYTGQEAQSASFSFMALPDNNKAAAIRLFARGDHSLV